MIDFWPQAIFLLKISSKISCEATPKKYPYKFRLNSDDCLECPPWIYSDDPMIRVLRVLRG